MIRANVTLHATPSIVLKRLPEDVSQAISHVSSILSLNSDDGIEPGELQGMSRMLAHAKQTWDEMKADSCQPQAKGDPMFSPRPIFMK